MAQKTVYTFPSADHVSTIHAVRWLPDEGPVKAVLQIVHGMVEYIERYTPFAEYLTTQGYAVYGHDHIGHGDSVKGPEEWGIMHADDPSDIMVEDMFTNFKHVKEEQPDVPYYILGHSMGSYMLRKYLAVKAAELKRRERRHHHGHRFGKERYHQGGSCHGQNAGQDQGA